MPRGRPLTEEEKETLFLGRERVPRKYRGTFTQNQLKRAVNAVRDAGLEIASIRVERGVVHIVPTTARPYAPPSPQTSTADIDHPVGTAVDADAA
jgi:hypothetical protein